MSFLETVRRRGKRQTLPQHFRDVDDHVKINIQVFFMNFHNFVGIMKTWGSQNKGTTKLRELSSRIAGRVVETRPFCRSEARLRWQVHFPNFRTSKIPKSIKLGRPIYGSSNLVSFGMVFRGFHLGWFFGGFSAVRLVFQAPPVHEHRFQSDKLRRKGPRDRGTAGLGGCTNWPSARTKTSKRVQCGAPKIAKLVYNSNNYGLW